MMDRPFIYKALVTNVVDGDTIDVVIDVGFKITMAQRLRLLRVDTNELHDKDPVRKAKALAAKAYVAERVRGRDVILRTEKSDVFGRYLAEVYLDGVNINDEIIEKGFSA